MNSTAAIFARLSDDTAIKAGLEVRKGKPAIFNDRAPDDFVFGKKAAIVIAAPTADADASTFSETVREVVQDVRVYVKDSGSTLSIDDLARMIRDLFHLRPAELTVTGGFCSLATATGPVAAPTTDPKLVGRRVSLRLQLQKDN